jgi:uncharacterized Zn-finger protein
VNVSHKCDVCGAAFSHGGHLNTHKLIHSGELPHKCDVCEDGFSQKRSLNIHKLAHSGERPHKCDVLGAGFSKNDLKPYKLTYTYLLVNDHIIVTFVDRSFIKKVL